MAFDLGGLLQQYLGSRSGQSTENAADHFQQVAQAASPQMVSQGLAEAFRSDQTPPFAQMVAQLFSQANPQQQAGMLNQLLSSLSPGALASLTNSGGLGGLLGQGGGGQPGIVAPQAAAQMTPEQVQQIASHAEQHSPTIIDQMSNFYAQHSGLVKTLGSAALTIALAKMANANRG
jgi:hypothetical protein